MATSPTCGPFRVFPCAELWGPLEGSGYVVIFPIFGPQRRQASVATSDFLPMSGIGDPSESKVHVSIFAHMWGISDFLPALNSGNPRKGKGLCSHLAGLWGNSETPRCLALGTLDKATSL